MTHHLGTGLAIARWAGSAHWVSLRLAESVGAWLPTVDDSTLRLLLGRHCGVLGAHASQWYGRIPTRRDVDMDHVIAPSSAEVASLLSTVADLTSDTERATALYAVLIPALQRDVDAALSQIRPDIDGPSARLCYAVLADLATLQHEASASVSALCNDSATHKRLAGLLPTSLLA